MLDLELTKDPASGETSVTRVGYVPYYMIHRDSAPVGERRYLLNIHQAMAEYEAGESQLVSDKGYRELQAALEHCMRSWGRRATWPPEPPGQEGDRWVPFT